MDEMTMEIQNAFGHLRMVRNQMAFTRTSIFVLASKITHTKPRERAEHKTKRKTRAKHIEAQVER